MNYDPLTDRIPREIVDASLKVSNFMNCEFGYCEWELAGLGSSTLVQKLRSRLAEVEKQRDEAREHNIKLYKNASKEICDMRQLREDQAMENFKLQYGNIKVGPDPYEIIEELKAELLAAKAVVEAARDHKTWFLCLSYKQNKLLVENQTLEIASKNWEKATEYQPLDYGPLLYALNAYDAALGAKEGEG